MDGIDTPNGGDVAWLHWMVGNKSLALSKLQGYLYDPGLLAKIVGVNNHPLRALPSPAELQRVTSLMP